MNRVAEEKDPDVFQLVPLPNRTVFVDPMSPCASLPAPPVNKWWYI